MFRRIPMIFRAPEDGAAGAGAGAAAATGDSLFDAAGDDTTKTAGTEGQDGQQQATGTKPTRPDTIPEQFWDAEKSEVRLHEMGKSWLDMRRKVSRGIEAPPEAPDAYTVPKLEGVPEGLIGGEGDALWPEIRKAAHAAGVTQKQLDALAAPFLTQMATEGGEAETPEARTARVEAEFAKLGPNGKQVVRDVGGWIAGMHGRGQLSDGEFAALRAVGTAEGVRALAKLRELAGEKPIPTDAIGDDAMAQADAERLMRDGFQKGDTAMVERGRQQLRKLEQAGRLIAPT
jgi:hypothetical protein